MHPRDLALRQIAALDDTSASRHLVATGSYAAFDEPHSVRIARKALRHPVQPSSELLQAVEALRAFNETPVKLTPDNLIPRLEELENLVQAVLNAT